MTPIRCSDDAGFAGRLGGGLTASGARPLLGLGAGFAGLAFFRDAGRSGAFLAVFFRIVLTFLTVFLRVPLLTGIFLRLVLALPFAFFLFAICSLPDAQGISALGRPSLSPQSAKRKREEDGPETYARGLPTRFSIEKWFVSVA